MHHISQNKIISINELWQFFNRSANLFCITGADGYLKQVNPHVIELLGFSEEKLLNTPYDQFIHPDDREYSSEQSSKVRGQSNVVQFRNRILTFEGDCKWISWTATYVADDESVYLIGQDYSETHSIEEKLKEEKLSKHKSVLEATLMGQEKERKEIGKELHDNVNQMLATVMLYHEMALMEKDQGEELIKKASEILRKTINEIRYLSKSLVGPDVRQMGLAECISNLLDTIQLGTNIKIRFRKKGSVEGMSAKAKLMIYRIIQEQTNNILKHAGARKIIIDLNRTKTVLFLLIKDDGKGFEVNSKRNGIGMNNIHSRADIFNGKVYIDSSPGNGCALRVEIPSSMLSESAHLTDQP